MGGVTQNSARFWTRLSGVGTVHIELSMNPSFSSSTFTNQETTTSARNFAAIVHAGGLLENTKYFYRAIVDGVAQPRVGSFNTFPAPGRISAFTFAFGSCQQSGPFLPSPNPKGKIFREVIRHQPKFFLQIGDWGYPDTTDNIPVDSNYFCHDYGKIQQSYLEKTVLAYPMDSLLMMTSVDYVYDDHDFMNNNSSATTASFSIPVRPSPYGSDFIVREILALPEGRTNSILGYKENFPTYSLVNESRGIYYKFTYGNVDVFMLDLRAQRSPNQNSIRKNPVTRRWEFASRQGQSILGRDDAPGSGQSQLNWFLQELQNSTATWKFIVSSVPFNVGQTAAMLIGTFLQDSLITLPGIPERISPIFATMELADKWCGFPYDAQTVLDHIRDNSIRNVIVLSGDQHTAAIDDGTNAGLPEIMAGGLDITNSRIVALFEAFGLHLWNKGGQGITTNEFNNAFGKISVFGADCVRLELIDEFGTQFASHTVLNNRTTDYHVIPSTPKSFSLFQNYPNPFDPATRIVYQLGSTAHVTLDVVDVLGKEVVTLVNEQKTAGVYSVDFYGSNLPSGMYFY